MLTNVPLKARLWWSVVNLAVVVVGIRYKLIGAIGLTSIGLQLYADLKPERRATVDAALRRYLPKRDAVPFSVIGLWVGTAAIGVSLYVTRLTVGRELARSEASLQQVVLSGLFWLVVFVEVAFLEELACRGFLYDWIDKRRGQAVAIVGSSVLFAALHSVNPHTSVRAVAFLVPAGLMFAGARYATNSLWLGIGMHFGWNFAEGWLFGTPVSGLHVSPLFRFRGATNNLWSGGSFGPEAGLSVVVVVTAIALLLIGIGLIRVRRDQGPGEVRLGVLDGQA